MGHDPCPKKHMTIRNDFDRKYLIAFVILMLRPCWAANLNKGASMARTVRNRLGYLLAAALVMAAGGFFIMCPTRLLL